MMFAPDEDKFEVRYQNTLLHCERLPVPGLTAFRVLFSSARPPLVVARARQDQFTYFWTSVPEGRQAEAEGVGELIEEYFANKMKR